MRVIIDLPPSALDDELSEKACKFLKAPVITADQWVPLVTFLALVLPRNPKFDIADHWLTKRLHVAIFIDIYNERHYFFHLYSVRHIVEKEVRKSFRHFGIPAARKITG